MNFRVRSDQWAGGVLMALSGERASYTDPERGQQVTEPLQTALERAGPGLVLSEFTGLGDATIRGDAANCRAAALAITFGITGVTPNGGAGAGAGNTHRSREPAAAGT